VVEEAGENNRPRCAGDLILTSSVKIYPVPGFRYVLFYPNLISLVNHDIDEQLLSDDKYQKLELGDHVLENGLDLGLL
jgi:hypothetical protein